MANWCEGRDVCVGNLGISRSDMPQLKTNVLPKYLTWLQKQGVSVTPGTVMVGSLTPSQEELNPDKVSELKGKSFLSVTPILISYDNYVLDGHHRWAALVEEDLAKVIPVLKLGLPIQELLEATALFDGVTKVDLQDRKVANLHSSESTAMLAWSWILNSTSDWCKR